MMRLVAALSALVLLGVAALPARAETFAWVQLGDDGAVIARAIVEDGTCPTLTADGAPLAMTVRAVPQTRLSHVPAGADFSLATACEAIVRDGTAALALGGARLPLPPKEIRRIVIFGDTGCRIKQSKQVSELQDCDDRDAWPYAKVIGHAAAAKPDLVIHVGDYAYRESKCPPSRNCEGPWGYGYDSWKADFFAPSQPLFRAAAWIMVRGNHEDCSRAGEGWLRFLDRDRLPRECRDLTGFFTVKAGGLRFVVMDNAAADAPAGDDRAVVDTLQEQFGKLSADASQQPTWLLSHRPFNALRYASGSGYQSDNDIQQKAIVLPASVQMVVSGHVHSFEALSFGAARPPQLVVGTGGDNLEIIPPQQVAGAVVNGATVAHGLIFNRFGYMLWEKGAGLWRGTFFDDDGRALAACSLAGRDLACTGS
jgi:predicted phosphodiesterase